MNKNIFNNISNQKVYENSRDFNYNDINRQIKNVKYYNYQINNEIGNKTTSNANKSDSYFYLNYINGKE